MPNCPVFKLIHDFRLQKPGRISGVLNSQGEVWKEQRNFMVKTLNTLGLRNSSLEDMEEVEKFCQCLEAKRDNPVQVVGLFNLPVLSVLWKMTTGDNVDYYDKKLQALR